MSNVSKLPARDWSSAQYALIRRTVAADCNDQEFDLFCHTARHLGLDPLRKQIYAFVFGKGDPKKRRLSIVVAIDGARSIAARSGNYRPDEDEPRYEYDETLRGPTNPLGLVKASVGVWQFSHSAWHKIAGVAYWSEFAPVKQAWAYDEEQGKRAPTDKYELDPTGLWPKMGRLLLAKCAEMQALRKGWPDDLGQLYAAEELDQAKVTEVLPSEAAAAGEVEERLERVGAKDTILVQWKLEDALVPVKVGQLADNILAFIRSSTQEEVKAFRDRNRFGMREFWSRAPSDALEVKKAIEAKLASEATTE